VLVLSNTGTTGLAVLLGEDRQGRIECGGLPTGELVFSGFGKFGDVATLGNGPRNVVFAVRIRLAWRPGGLFRIGRKFRRPNSNTCGRLPSRRACSSFPSAVHRWLLHSEIPTMKVACASTLLSKLIETAMRGARSRESCSVLFNSPVCSGRSKKVFNADQQEATCQQ